MWTYRARLGRIIDGDTIDVLIDVGFRITMTHRLRLLGVDTPEVRGAEKEAGLVSKSFVVRWIDEARGLDPEWPLRVTTVETDSFGRWLATIENARGDSLGDALLAKGLAEPWR